MNTISPQDLASKFDSGEEVELIDVRTPIEFQEVHVEFARNIPLDTLDPQVVAEKYAAKKDPVYLICKSGSRGKMACEKLTQAGFENAINVEGGTDSCVQTSLPLKRGKKIMSLERQVRIAAGALVLVGVLAGWLVHPAFYGLSGFIGAGLMFAGITDTCAMGMLIAKMPWNQVPECSAAPNQPSTDHGSAGGASSTSPVME